MTYEEYAKAGNLITKEEYLKEQKEMLKKEIRTKRITSNLITFLGLSAAALLALASAPMLRDNSYFVNCLPLEEKVLLLASIPLVPAVAAVFRYHVNKDLKILKAIKIELPTTEELEDYNRGQYHLSESNRYNSKIR